MVRMGRVLNIDEIRQKQPADIIVIMLNSSIISCARHSSLLRTLSTVPRGTTHIYLFDIRLIPDADSPIRKSRKPDRDFNLELDKPRRQR